METAKPIRFWNRKYGVMCLVNLLVSISIFAHFPLFTYSIGRFGDQPALQSWCIMGLSVGMFLLGPFNAYFVDAFRRKRVCEVSLVCLIICTIVGSISSSLVMSCFLLLLAGACFGVFEMSLGATLINDLSISKRRTATDYYFTWFGLFGLPLGAGLAVWGLHAIGVDNVYYVTLALQILSLLLLHPIKIPFRAPNRVPLMSFDRFFHPGALLLMIALLPIAIVPGLFITGHWTYQLLFMMGGGFIIGFAIHRVFFMEADSRSDAVAGLILVMTAMLVVMHSASPNAYWVSSVFLGVGLGWFDSRMLLYFVKMADHCQRGTLQQTYIITLITGNCLGYVLGMQDINVQLLSLILAAVSLIFYLTVVLRWFKHIKGRDFKFREI